GEPNNIYLWAWYFDHCGDFGSGPVLGNGDWDNSADYLQMTNNGNGTYSYTLTPSAFYGDTEISQMGVLVKADNGNGDKKTQDHLEYVGQGITINIINPSSTPVVLNNGDNLSINATMASNGTNQFGVLFETFYNEVSQHSGTGTPTYGTTLTNMTTSGTVRIQATYSGEVASCSFDVIIAPTVTSETLPAGMEDGINYDPVDDTVATLVLNAPLKDFVYIAGSFNNYNPDNSYLMKKDDTPGSTKYWLQLTGLTQGQVEHYQYWVYALNPVTDSPSIVKTADPFSTLVLNPYDDPFISETSFPGITSTYLYPAGQEREVTVLQTGQTPYNWQVPNFTKPKKEDLIVYEVLIRDFDADRNFQDLIDKIDYFKNLQINAIELMPVMEFEGNEGWGYNTSFHMALDKFYGTGTKLKEFIDLCHQNGIAVILDLALNHAYGRSPMVRMWMNDPDNNGWDNGVSSENPYFNQSATHSYSVGLDFNHSQAITQYYAERVVKQWIEEFKIDGFRWDLTKGFTQNCSSGDETCTNAYQQDRVDILKAYADYSWGLDETHYMIFEHLGDDSEEQQWANYRIGDPVPKGVMMWSEMWTDYKNLANGSSSNFDRMGHVAHGFTEKRTLGYPESHDKDRIMYEMTTFGNGGAGYPLNTALTRMSALGAVTIPIPGPKMLWHFADLGMDNSIWLCSDGVTVNSDYDGFNDGDCKLDTKPQPQWTEMWLSDPNRSQIYNDWARINSLKVNEDVFEGNYSINSGTLTPRIYIWDDALPANMLKNVVILANFSNTSQDIVPDFPYTGTWHDLMDDTGSTSISVLDTTDPITIASGGFRIYGNAIPETLSNQSFEVNNVLKIYPNPVENTFSINKTIDGLQVYDITGKLIKSFDGTFEKGHGFDISELTQSIYFIKIKNSSGEIQSAKLIKI
ncbi:MAG: T9SS type A sorting domain-containing protein, partial [Bacteroidia bacterium]|nr:T9SS type A sorting domain-containing protein [Bacteroidia bacterium]